jgi:hypothetical protein
VDIRTLTVAALAATVLAGGAGCQGARIWGDKESFAAQGVPSAALSPQVRGERGSILQASASSAATQGSWTDSIAKLAGMTPRKPQATEMTILWRNRIDYLPDHTKNGQMGPGLVGQLFLFDPRLHPSEPDGKLIVALYDETPRPAGQPGNKPEGWEFDKATLQQLVTIDERFGRCYALFLPWPTYRPDVKNIRIAARYEPDNGFQLYAPECRIAIDTSPPGSAPRVEWKQQVVPASEYRGGLSPPPGDLASPGGTSAGHTDFNPAAHPIVTVLGR